MADFADRQQNGAESLLFLSCDLTGSTRFKQIRSARKEPWQKAFLQFYREFPQRLANVQAEVPGAESIRFNLWKPIGDELIFTCRVESELEIYACIQVWKLVMTQYMKKHLDTEERKGLGVKGGAFLATFPGPDSRSSIPRTPLVEAADPDVVVDNKRVTEMTPVPHADYLLDYFGPSIDTGFRILSRCTARYMTVSLEVAYALLLADHDQSAEARNVDISDLVFLGGEVLKGVWGEGEYPLFAIDVESEDPINAAFEAVGPNRRDLGKMRNLCREHYEHDEWPYKMYLPKASNPKMFKTIPEDVLARYIEEAAKNNEGSEMMPSDEGAELIKEDAVLER